MTEGLNGHKIHITEGPPNPDAEGETPPEEGPPVDPFAMAQGLLADAIRFAQIAHNCSDSKTWAVAQRDMGQLNLASRIQLAGAACAFAQAVGLRDMVILELQARARAAAENGQAPGLYVPSGMATKL